MLVLMCSICLEPMNQRVLRLQCQHYFHYQCYIQHRLRGVQRRLCPVCRSTARVDQLDLEDTTEPTLVSQVWFQILVFLGQF